MLNDLIFIEKRNYEIKEGRGVSNWQKELSCWACMEKASSKEIFSAQSYRTQIEKIYKIRNSNKTKELNTNGYRLIHKGKVHDIKSIIEYGKKGEFLKIECEMEN